LYNEEETGTMRDEQTIKHDSSGLSCLLVVDCTRKKQVKIGIVHLFYFSNGGKWGKGSDNDQNLQWNKLHVFF
jgi:hypothetical protein